MSLRFPWDLGVNLLLIFGPSAVQRTTNRTGAEIPQRVRIASAAARRYK